MSSFKKTTVPSFPNQLVSTPKFPTSDQSKKAIITPVSVPPKVNPPVNIIKPVSPPQSNITITPPPKSAPIPIKVNPPTAIVQMPIIQPVKPSCPCPINTFGLSCSNRPRCCCTGFIDHGGNAYSICINDIPSTLIPKNEERDWLPPVCNGGFQNGCGVWIRNCLYRKVPYVGPKRCGCKFYVPPSVGTCKPKIRTFMSRTPPYKNILFQNVPWNPTISMPPRDCIPIDGCLFCPISSQPIVGPTPLPLPPINGGTRTKATWLCSGQRKAEMITYHPKGFLDKRYPEIIGYAMCSRFIRQCPIVENIGDAMKLTTFFKCSFYIITETAKEVRLDYISTPR